MLVGRLVLHTSGGDEFAELRREERVDGGYGDRSLAAHHWEASFVFDAHARYAGNAARAEAVGAWGLHGLREGQLVPAPDAVDHPVNSE